MKYIYFFALLFLAIFLLPFLIKIKVIECNNQYGKCSQEIESEVTKFENTSYKNLDRSLTDYLKKIPRIDSYNYSYIPPYKLKINLIEKKPIVVLNYDGKNVLLSEDLTEIEVSDTTQLPVLFVKSTIDNKSEKLKFAVKLLAELNKYYSVNEAILDNNIKIVYDGRTEIIFPTEGDIDVLLGSLEIMLFQLNDWLENSRIDLRAENVKVIDLRFKNPLIK